MSGYVQGQLRRNPYITIEEDIFFEDDKFSDSYYDFDEHGRRQITTAAGSPSQTEQASTAGNSSRRLDFTHIEARSPKTLKTSVRKFKLSIIALTVVLIAALCGLAVCFTVIMDLQKTNKRLLNLCASNTSAIHGDSALSRMINGHQI